MITPLFAVASVGLHGLLVGALVILIVLAIVIGFVYLIERYISPIPGLIKLILAVVILVLIVIWAAGQLGVGL